MVTTEVKMPEGSTNKLRRLKPLQIRTRRMNNLNRNFLPIMKSVPSVTEDQRRTIYKWNAAFKQKHPTHAITLIMWLKEKSEINKYVTLFFKTSVQGDSVAKRCRKNPETSRMSCKNLMLLFANSSESATEILRC